jgi:outer membrane protein assembly factor BamB
MKISDSSPLQNPYAPTGKPAVKAEPSVFGSDKVQTGSSKEQFGLTQNQIQTLFDKTPKAIGFESPSIWKANIDGFENSYDGCMFSSNGDFYSCKLDRLCNFDGKTGDTKWVRDLTSPLAAINNPLIEGKDGTAIAICKDNRIRGLDPATGDEKWNLDLGASFNTPVKVLENGDIAVIRKVDDQMCLTRLNADGTEKSTAQLGFWDEPFGTPPVCKAEFINEEKNGNILVHGNSLEGKKVGTNYVPMHIKTYCVTPDGKVPWSAENMEPPASFSDNPDRLFMVDYEKMKAFDKNTGATVWEQKKSYLKGKTCGDTFFDIAGEQKHKYIKFVDSRDGKLIIQTYSEGPLRKTKSGEEIICVDQNDLSKTYWKKDSAGSIFKGPLYVDKDVILHLTDEDKGTLEALDPSTGSSKWSVFLNEPTVKPDGTKTRTEVKKALKTEDGSFFVMTKQGVYGINGQTGKIKSVALSAGELSQFQVDPKSGTILAYDKENKTAKKYTIEFLTEQNTKAAMKTGEQDAAQEPQSPTIQETEKEVIIGGVSLKKAR